MWLADMRKIPSEDLLDIVGCEIDARPQAPGLDALAPYILGVSRDARAIVVTFVAEAAGLVEAFAAAERVCCAGIGWEVELGSPVILRITAGADALDALEQLVKETNIDNHR